ncbi:unnamed protein product, partial [Ectocarpus sp. 12 AP-2014]
ALRAHKFKKSLPVMVECVRIARRWTPTMLFRLYTSLEVKAEAERQATQLWEEGFTYAPAMTGDDTETPPSAPRVVFENALTEEGFLGFARDLDLLGLPFATHTGLISLFRRYASKLTKGAALQARAKGLFSWLCKSSGVHRLGKEDIAKLLDGLGLPRISDEDALPYTYADGMWDSNAFCRHVHDNQWITEVAGTDESVTSGNRLSGSADGASTDSRQRDSDESSTSSDGSELASAVSDSSVSTDDSIPWADRFVGMKKDGFEKAIQELACTVRLPGEACECEGCSTRRVREAKLEHQEGTTMDKEMERLRINVHANELHTSWATVRLYFEVLAPNAAKLFAAKANASQDIFGSPWFSPTSRNLLFENDQMLREIFLTLVGRQGDRDALNDRGGGSRNQSEDTTVLKGLRADCRWVLSLASCRRSLRNVRVSVLTMFRCA